MQIFLKWFTALLLPLVLTGHTMARAESLQIHGPFSSTGTYQAMLRLIADGLEKKGWNLDVKITGNAKLSREVFETTKSPFLLAWGTENNSSKTDPHYLKPPGEHNLVGFSHRAPGYFCSFNKDISESDFTTRKLKIGIVNDKATVNWLNSWMHAIGHQHQLVSYRGSGDVEIGASSGEVDVLLSSRGAQLLTNGTVKCFFNTGQQTMMGVPSLQSKFPAFKDSTIGFGFYIISKNLSAQQLDKLRKDFVDVKKNYKPFVDHATRMHFPVIFDDLSAQIGYIERLDRSLD